jgi:RNA-binding protein
MASLSGKQIRNLRAQAHALKPVVIVGGNGLTDNVLSEIEQAVEHHELIKIRLNAADKAERDAMIETICEKARSELVQRIGHIIAVYRKNHENPSIDPGRK